VIRHAANQGCTAVTAAGIGAATTKYVLSIDADMRLDPDWLEKCLPVAARKDVGMAASRIEHKTGSLVLDAYLDAMYSQMELSGPVRFIPGPVYLMRKEAYDAAGGFSGYADKRGQDTHLCRKMAVHGFTLYRVPGVAAYQTRRLSLPQCLKRCASWDLAYFERRMAGGAALEELLPLYVAGTGKRMETLEQAGGLVRYVHLVHLLYGSMRVAKAYGEGARQGLWGSYVHFLRDKPHTLEALSRDANRLGLGECGAGEKNRFGGMEELLADSFSRETLDVMEAALAVSRVDEPERTDFSMYETD